MKRIGINVSSLRQGRSITGIENFIIQVLTRMIDTDNENEFYLFSNGPLSIDIPQRDNVKLLVSNVSNLFVYSRYTIWKEIKENKIDVFWVPTPTLPFITTKKTKYFITIYDLANYKLDNIAKYSEIKRKLFFHLTKVAAQKADGIITISNASKKDIIEAFKVQENKNEVVYLGGIGNTCEDEDPSILKKFNLNKYYLYVGTLQPRKNIETMVKAFINLRESGQFAKLVLAGKVGWGMEGVLEEIKNSTYKEDIILTGFISDSEKIALYKNCTAFLFPSLYEGFGIPILEAFQYGIPVITARNSSLPEVGGDAAIYMEDVLSSNELSNLMSQTLSFSAEDREAINRNDRAQLSTFSWEKCAREVHTYILR